MGSCIDPAIIESIYHVHVAIMLSIYHVHVANMLSYSNCVTQISISFIFAQIIFFKRKSFIIKYIAKIGRETRLNSTHNVESRMPYSA